MIVPGRKTGFRTERVYRVEEKRSLSLCINSRLLGWYEDKKLDNDCWNRPTTKSTRRSPISGAFPAVVNVPFGLDATQSSGRPSNESNPNRRDAEFRFRLAHTRRLSPL